MIVDGEMRLHFDFIAKQLVQTFFRRPAAALRQHFHFEAALRFAAHGFPHLHESNVQRILDAHIVRATVVEFLAGRRHRIIH